MPFDDRQPGEEDDGPAADFTAGGALQEDAIILDCFDESALFEIQALQRIGFWPERSSLLLTKDGGPFISEIGNFRSLHFAWNSVQSGMVVSDPIKLALDYTRVMMGFLFFNRRPRTIEMIGLGGGSLAKFCYDILPDTRITVVEICPDIIELREHFFIPADDHRFQVLCADGADFVRDAPAATDVLLIDGYDADGQPPRLSSPEFYDACHEHLAPDGLMVVNLLGGAPDYERCLRRMRRSFHSEPVVIASAKGYNRTVFVSKNQKIALTRPQIKATCASLRQPQAKFLPSVGERIRVQIARRRALWGFRETRANHE